MRHTPGKWKNINGSIISESITYSNDRSNRVCYLEHDSTPPGEVEANARLIASSPTMFDFIKSLADKGDENAKAFIASIGL